MNDADLVINRFRQQVRTDLRIQASRGSVPADAAELLRRRLDEVRSELLASFADRR